MKSGKKAGRQGIGPRNPAPRRAARAAAPRLPSEPRPAARPSAAHGRQRLRLIDACISALHIHGPSRTTVEKVVAIANMSPGIVRFYFDSKAAMLVASLQFLAAEFERRVLEPVAMLKADPVAALERLVDLYLDPEIASPRKVAVWYAFWGEASSRQEYYDICGQKDDRFAALVRELIERLIIETQRPHLDPDGVALGLIGVLEMLWQGFAFQAEVNIDRPAAKHRCMAYLRSIFPGAFVPTPLRRPKPEAGSAGRVRLPRWSFASAAAHDAERAELFAGSYQFVGDQRAILRPGAYLALDTGSERALVVRDESGALRAFRNSCPDTPHELAGGYCGQFVDVVACPIHGQRFHYDGTAGASRPERSLPALELRLTDDWIWVCGTPAGTRHPSASIAEWRPGMASPGFYGTAALQPFPVGSNAIVPDEIVVLANWKIVVEQWLASAPGWTAAVAPPGGIIPADADADADAGAPGRALIADAARVPAADGWSARHYRSLLGIGPETPWRRRFIAPNQLIERRPDGVTVFQALPTAPGRTTVRTFEYPFRDHAASAATLRYLARRLTPERLRAGIALAESVQEGIAVYGYRADRESVGPGTAAFHEWLFSRMRYPEPSDESRQSRVA